MNYIKLLKTKSFFIFALFLSSCTSLGPVYQKSNPPAEKAIIYFYRPSAVVGFAITYSLWDITKPINTKKVTIVYDHGKDLPRIDKYEKGIEDAINLATISNGSYYAYTINPGTYYFMQGGANLGQWGVTDFITKVDAQAGKQYYFYSMVGAGGRPYIETRTVEQGEKEIVNCKLALKENN